MYWDIRTYVLCMYRHTHFGGVSCHDDSSGRCVKLWSPCSADHLKDLRLAVLTEPTVHVLHGGFDHHQVGGEVDPHGKGAGADYTSSVE